MKRIRRLLEPKSPNGAWTPLFGAVVLILTAAVALVAWQGTPPPAVHEASPYLRWLNQDVVYIIADGERAAFLKLTADEEREKFIEQFWARRNPTPGASANAFQEEHYRRIAYANKHWGMASTPGWQTDRGHMYIVYGPPEEIESHPQPAQGVSPFEDWRYYHVAGTGGGGFFTFIDRTGRGDYRLAPSTAK